MRKFARVILVLALVLGVSVSVFAAGAPKSQEQRLVPINGEVAPGDYVGWTEDKNGNFIDYVNEKDVDFAEPEGKGRRGAGSPRRRQAADRLEDF